jgi:DNA primase
MQKSIVQKYRVTYLTTFEERELARVPEAELERLKAEVSLERLAEAGGIELRRHGDSLLGLCPFHEDHEPSLVISPTKNLWHCLGACQAGGSVVDWVMRAQGVSFRHAVEILRADPPFAASAGVRTARRSTVPSLPSPVVADVDDAELLEQVVGYYHRTLLDAPEARGYLASRGLDDAELVDRFRLGFANRTLGLRLPEKSRVQGRELRSRLQRLGVLRESGHEHFNGSLVVPISDEGGRVSELYGRKITPGLRPGTPLHLYLPGPHRGVWNLAGLGAEGAEDQDLGDGVILCEALIDAMTFWVAGLRRVTASYGIEGFMEDHLRALTACGAQRVYLAYDRDPAGERAAVQLVPRLVAAGFDVFRVQFPPGQDANAFACEDVATAPERLREVLRRAVWLGRGAASVPAQPAVPSPTAIASTSAATASVIPALAQTGVPPPPFAAAAGADQGAVADIAVSEDEDELLMTAGERRWRARGLLAAQGDQQLRVLLWLCCGGEGGEADGRFHADTLDLYSAKQRAQFVHQGAQETGLEEATLRRDLGRVLLAIEAQVAERRRRDQAAPTVDDVAALSPEEREQALALLRSPDLLEQVAQAYVAVGVVGEETNALVAYLAATSRLLERPLAVVVQSTSAAGKSALLEATLALLPERARVRYSAMTGQSLYYMGEQELRHKVLAVAEEAGAQQAAYALKLLQSEGELRIASTGKDAQTGRLVTHEYHVQGPVALFLTTTAIDVDEELLNRCLLLTVDEDREQTRAIHRRQREQETLQGLLADQERQRVIRLHRAAQTLLRPLHVVNPYAEQLTFADTRTRTRRDHQKYLALIRTVALLHQHQRELRRASTAAGELEYLEVTPQDIAIANSLAHEVLGRSLDELPPQTRRLLRLLDAMVRERTAQDALEREAVRLTRAEIRAATGYGHSQLAVHLTRLCALEYVTAHVVGRGGRHVYELTWSDDAGEGARLDGLIDPAALGYDKKRPGDAVTVPAPAENLPGWFRPGSGVVPGPFRGADNGPNSSTDNGIPPVAAGDAGNAVTGSDDEAGRTVVVAGVRS